MSQISRQLEQFQEYLRSEKKDSAKTQVTYLSCLRRFITWGSIGTTDEVTLAAINGFKRHLGSIRNQRGELLKTTTRNFYLIAIRSFLNFLRQRGLVSVPLGSVTLSRSPRTRSSVLSPADIERLLAAPMEGDAEGVLQKRDKALLELLFSTGLKVSQISLLKKNQVNYFAENLNIKDGAGIKTIPFGNMAKFWIKKYLESRNDDIPALFIRHDKAKEKQLGAAGDYRLTPRTIQRIVKKYAKRCGISSGSTPEKIRQAYAQYLTSQGYDLKEVQNLLGHASITTTKLYTSN